MAGSSMGCGAPTACTGNRGEDLQGTAREGAHGMRTDGASVLESLMIALLCAAVALLAFILDKM